jgi:hypothetical protein
VNPSNGRVTSAIPEARDDTLGRCVADALRAASFPAFRRPSLALRYAVTL